MCQPHQHYAPTSENILSCQYSINLNDAYIDRYRKIKYKEKIFKKEIFFSTLFNFLSSIQIDEPSLNVNFCYKYKIHVKIL